MLRAILLLALLPFTASSQIVISQIYGGGGNAGATLRNDFIELFNRGGQAVDVTGWSVQYASATGTAWQVTRLTGVIEPGQYFLVQEAAGAGGTADLPTPDVTGAIAMSATAAKIALVSNDTALTGGSPTGPAIVDLVGYGTADFSETAPAPGLSNTTAAIRRGAGCVDTNNNAADFQSGAPAPRNRASARGDCSATPPPAVTVSISSIQGAGDRSPLEGRSVTTTGIVTARRSNGFYIQSAPADTDNDDATSEGILVFTSSAPPASAAVGNLVRVSGTVTEFVPAADLNSPALTEITSPTVEVISQEHDPPAAVEVTRAMLAAGGGGSQLERFEGMRVRARALRVVGPTGGSINEAQGTVSSNGVFYGVLEGVPRPFREPGVQAPDPLPAGASRWDGNPERLRVDSDGLSGTAAVNLAVGDVADLTGVLDYGFRTYTLLPAQVESVSFALRAAQPVIAPSAQEIAVASFNVRRLFDTTDDPGTSDPVLTQAALDRRLTKLTTAFRELLRAPDVIGVIEVENLATLQALAARLGPEYRAYLEEGNDIGGIDVGFLVKTSRITVVDVAQIGKSATYTTPAGAQATLHDRPPLVLRARIGEFPFTVVVNHLRSLIDVQDSTVQAKRRAQADALADLVRTRLAADSRENLIVLGDFNAFAFDDGYVDSLARIRAGGDLVNLTDTLPREQSYTYVQDGSAQSIDHILVHRNLMPRLSRYVVARINADFPETLAGDGAARERTSDHDVPVAYFALAPGQISAASATNAGSFLGGDVSPGEIVTIFGFPVGPEAGVFAQIAADGQSIAKILGETRVLFDGVAAPMVYAQARQVSAIVPYGVAGRATTNVRVEYRGQLTNEVTLPVAATVPGVFAILNQDGSANGGSAGAEKDSIVVIFATGEGRTDPPGEDGRIAIGTAPKPWAPVSVIVDGFEAEVLYAGGVSGFTGGLLQVNARVPRAARSGRVPLLLQIGEAGSQQGLTLEVK